MSPLQFNARRWIANNPSTSVLMLVLNPFQVVAELRAGLLTEARAVPVAIWLYGEYALLYYASFALLRGRGGLGPAEFAMAVQPYLLLGSLVALAAFFAFMRRLLPQAAMPLSSGR